MSDFQKINLFADEVLSVFFTSLIEDLHKDTTVMTALSLVNILYEKSRQYLCSLVVRYCCKMSLVSVKCLGELLYLNV